MRGTPTNQQEETMMKFIENIGNASTSAWLGKRYLGRNVNAAAYRNGNEIVVKLESNCTPVRGVAAIHTTPENYAAFCQPTGRPLFVRAIELFGATVALKSEAVP